jgi:hypothetical protein
MLSGIMGPAFYPAGHFLHYLPIYYLHMATPYAGLISQALMAAVHALTIQVVSSVMLKYYEKQPERAQFLTLVLAANFFDHRLFELLQNDAIMGLYVFLAIYFLAAKRNSVAASVALGLGLSVKAGAILLLPAFLGAVQYSFGTKKLVLALAIVVAIQVAVAVPFLEPFGGKTAVGEYLSRCRYAGNGRGMVANVAQEEQSIAAGYDFTIFWSFLPKAWYYNEGWV